MHATSIDATDRRDEVMGWHAKNRRSRVQRLINVFVGTYNAMRTWREVSSATFDEIFESMPTCQKRTS